MAPKLFSTLLSAPVRSVLLCAKELGIQLDLQEVNLAQKDQLIPEYLKLNPLHTIPTLVDDDGFVVYDSHAIMAYLVGKYGQDKSFLYPTDIKKRATIDQRLHFDTGILFVRGLILTKSILYGGVKEVSKSTADGINEAYGFVETFLEKSKYVAGDDMTIADFSILTTITSWEIFVPIDSEKYPKITTWLKQLASLRCYDDINKAGVKLFRKRIEAALSA